MKVPRRPPFLLDVAEDPADVFDGQPYRGGNGLRRQAVVVRVQAEVELLVWQGEVELFLALCERVGVRRRLQIEDRFRAARDARRGGRPASCRGARSASRPRRRRRL